MRLLIVARHFAALRNYESVVRGLVARGHDVELAALQDDGLGGHAMVQRWQSELPALRLNWAPGRPVSDGEAVTQKVRFALDWVRYLSPVYRDTPRLVTRARERTPRAMLWLTSLAGMRTATLRRAFTDALRGLERALPRVPAVDAFLAERRPDVVMLTPLIGLGSPELDYLRSAQALSLRTLFGVWSWDNLSSKALIRWVPDRIAVWNDTQRTEAVELHGVPADRVVVTGAQCFDQWFDRQPSRDRGAFCAHVGLPDAPFVLYVCSALFRGSPIEAEFVRRWLTGLRQSGEARLRDLPVLIRPHPSRLKEWSEVSLDGLGPVVLWGRNPIDTEARADYFDSLSHSVAVVGLNTSAFLEAAIAGRPVLAMLLEEFRDNQEGTLHFPYLLNVAGGLLHTSRSLEAHYQQLSDTIADPARHAERSVRFVEVFLRPFGRGEAATPRMIAAIEELAASPVRQRGSSEEPSAASRLAFSLLERAYRLPVTRSLFWDPLQIDEERRRAVKLREHRRTKRRQHWQAQVARARRHFEERREKAAARRAKRRVKDERLREKQRRTARVRRERLQAAIVNRLRRAFGGSTD